MQAHGAGSPERVEKLLLGGLFFLFSRRRYWRHGFPSFQNTSLRQRQAGMEPLRAKKRLLPKEPVHTSCCRAARPFAVPSLPPAWKRLWRWRDGVWGREEETFLQKGSSSLPQQALPLDSPPRRFKELFRGAARASRFSAAAAQVFQFSPYALKPRRNIKPGGKLRGKGFARGLLLQ